MLPTHNQVPDQRIGKGFSKLALVYDAVVFLVFRNQLSRLQFSLFKAIRPHGHVLVIGGGTGLVLEQLFSFPEVKHVTYIELSRKMLDLSARRIDRDKLNMVTFRQFLIPSDHSFDLVVLPFVLDCYTPKMIAEALEQLKQRLHPEGIIALVDFNQESGTAYQPSAVKRWFLRILYKFFGWCTKIPAKRLALFQRLFVDAGFDKTTEIYASKGWLQALAWRQSTMK